MVAITQKLSDLEVSLFNLKQNVQIEEVALEFHPDIVEAGKKVCWQTNAFEHAYVWLVCVCLCAWYRSHLVFPRLSHLL